MISRPGSARQAVPASACQVVRGHRMSRQATVRTPSQQDEAGFTN
ncbi:hypothetical protein ACFPM0_36490 [Pseudonocardia sulfidoxydans]